VFSVLQVNIALPIQVITCYYAMLEGTERVANQHQIVATFAQQDIGVQMVQLLGVKTLVVPTPPARSRFLSVIVLLDLFNHYMLHRDSTRMVVHQMELQTNTRRLPHVHLEHTARMVYNIYVPLERTVKSIRVLVLDRCVQQGFSVHRGARAGSSSRVRMATHVTSIVPKPPQLH